jgi:diguanylate cyclase (GGDEF)-like protein/PAS domain S-box-containing protein
MTRGSPLATPGRPKTVDPPTPGIRKTTRAGLRRTTPAPLPTREAHDEARYRGLFEAAPDAMVVVDHAGVIVYLNMEAEKRFGSSRDELVGKPVTNIIPEGLDGRAMAGIGIELTALRTDGSAFPIEVMLSPLEGPDGVLLTAAIRDITVRRASEARNEGRYRGLLEAAPDAMVVVDHAGVIVLLNVQAEKRFGYSRDELVGQPVTNIIPDGFAERLIADDLRSTEDALAQVIGTGMELTALRKDGSKFPIEIMLSPLASPDGVLVTAAIRDISSRKDAEQALVAKVRELHRSNEDARAMALEAAHAAHHDFLTGLPNRVLLNDRISQAIAMAPRHSKQLAVLFLDLDGFKHINDSLGHPVGDRLLQLVATRLQEQVRDSDTVSRQGGDEFVVLLSEAEAWDNAAVVAKRITEAIAEPHLIGGKELHITTSIGISVFPDDGADAETLIKNADTAMYQAKEDGRSGIRFFKPEMNVQAVQRQMIEQSLRLAVEREEFVLHYQPKIDMTSGAVTGAEALIRWSHPTRGIVPPVQFIPIAEQSGLIIPIGRWVLREACRQMRSWLDAGLKLSSIAVNVSAVDLREDDFLDNVMAALEEAGLDPGMLELELTETVLMKHIGDTAAVLQTLREQGVRISIDDFGTGYSSLSYLHRFPIDSLKIDRSFVSQIGVELGGSAIVAAIISMARSLRLRVVAEGVETEAQLAFLDGLACDEAQGFYFSRGVAADQFVAYVRGKARHTGKRSAA